MKSAVRVLLTSMICLVIVPAVLGKKPAAQRTASVTGVYDNFTVGKGSGDLEGMRVVLVSAGNEYHAIVQIAQGGAEDPKPEWVLVQVKGNTLNFTVGDEKFNGTVTTAGLRLKRSSGSSQLLKRKPCLSYFN
jgi:hypothetical protein